MLYGIANWGFKNDIKRLERAEKSMVEWTCIITVRDGPISRKLIPNVSNVHFVIEGR